MKYDGRILEKDEIERLGVEALDGNDAALHLLVETHINMFYKMAQPYRPAIEADEAVAIMVENVVEKFPHKFDPTRGNFTKYAKLYAFHGIQWYLKFRRKVVHFPRRRPDAGEIVSTEETSDLSKEPGADTFTQYVDDEHKAHLREVIRLSLQQLEPLQREVVRLRFGLDEAPDAPGRMRKYREIGEILGRSNEWVRVKLLESFAKLGPVLSRLVD